MEKITAFIDGIELEKLMPDLQELLARLEPIVKWAVMAGPVILLFFGLIYLFIPPKEANHSLGFRTYFGMGSVEAWRFTQRIAGLVLTALGLILTIVMAVIVKHFAGLDAFLMMHKAAKCLLWQLALVVIAYLGISIVAAVFFDRNGERRIRK